MDTAGERSRWARVQRLEFLAVSLVFHLLFTWSIFDIYFRSPVVHPTRRFRPSDVLGGPDADSRAPAGGAPPLPPPSPARRAVVMVADGLRADTAFRAHAAADFPDWAQRDLAGADGTVHAYFGSAFQRGAAANRTETALVVDGQHGGTHAYAAPHLRDVAQARGRYGVSHTRVPTESRPGHVALLAGMYEDISAVTKGWKVNPLAFDSLLNQSAHAFAYGSPDIVPMFALGAAPGRVTACVYDGAAEDFTKDAAALDEWVLDALRDLLARAQGDAALDAQLRAPQTLFFLHFLGLDTTGHTYRPMSPEYLGNTVVVDAIAHEVERLFRDFFDDQCTAFFVTADHGMSRRGNHGDGDPDNTRTPLLAWGAGIRAPVYSDAGARIDERAPDDRRDAYFANWGLDLVERVDVEQADIAPLVAALLGIAVPANSEGRLPLAYVDASDEYQARAALATARQVLEVYEVKHADRAARMVSYAPFPRLSGTLHGAARVDQIATYIARGDYRAAMRGSDALVHAALAGARYLHQYDAPLLSVTVVLGYVGVFLYGVVVLLPQYAFGGRAATRRAAARSAAAAVLLATVWAKLRVERQPRMYYVYTGASAGVWCLFLARVDAIPAAVRRAAAARGTTASRTLARTLATLAAALVLVEATALGYLHRTTWTLVMLAAAAAGPLQLSAARHGAAVAVWMGVCMGTGWFTAQPTEKEESITQLAVSGALLLLLGTAVCAWPRTFLSEGSDADGLVFLPRVRRALAFSLVSLAAATVITVASARSLRAKRGLPRVNQAAGWAVLMCSATVPPALGFQRPRTRADGRPARQPVRQRVVLFVFACAPGFVLLSLRDEVLFYVCYTALCISWAHIEAETARAAVAASPRPPPPRGLTLDDVRIGMAYFLLLHIGFFGTGNVASISSFYLSPVYRLVPVFSPFLMSALLVLKLIVPFVVLSCVLVGLAAQRVEHRAQPRVMRRVPVLASGVGLRDVFIPLHVAALAGDVLALNFFFAIRDSGSWLEIGQSITHFVMANLLQVYMLVIASLAGLLMGRLGRIHNTSNARGLSPIAQTIRSQARTRLSARPQSFAARPGLAADETAKTAAEDTPFALAQRHVAFLVWQLAPDNCDETVAELASFSDKLSDALVPHITGELSAASASEESTPHRSAARSALHQWQTIAPPNGELTTMFHGLPDVPPNGLLSIPPDATGHALLAAALDHLAHAPAASLAPAPLAPYLAFFLSDPQERNAPTLSAAQRQRLVTAVAERAGAESTAQALRTALPNMHYTAGKTAASILQEWGPDGLPSADLARAVLARAGWTPTPDEFAALLAALLSSPPDLGASRPVTNYGVLVQAVAEMGGASFDWAQAVRGLDALDVLVLTPNATQGASLADVLAAAPRGDAPHAVCGLWGVWTHRVRQLQLLYVLLMLSDDGFPLAAFRTRAIVAMDDVASAPPAVQRQAQHAASSKWNSLDLLETLMELAASAAGAGEQGEVGKIVTAILELAIKTHAECVLLGLLQLPQGLDSVHPELVTKLLTMFLAGHPSHQLVFWRLWTTQPALLLDVFTQLYAENALQAARMVDIAQELGFVEQLLDVPALGFALDIAALAARRELLNLQAWLQQRLAGADARALRGTLEYLEGKVKEDLMRRDPQAEPTFVPLNVQTVATLLRVLRTHGDTMAREEIEHFKIVRNLCLQLHPRLMVLTRGPEATEPGLAVASFSKEIHREADSWYRQMYEEKVSVDDIVALLQRCKFSEDAHDRQLFACMVHTLFDEHRWFELYYPPRELLMTAAVFGALVQHQLVDSIPLGIAIRYVLDALRSAPESNMFHFGVQALLRFQGRLGEWPQLCQALASLPQLQQTHPELLAIVDHALAAATSGYTAGGDSVRADGAPAGFAVAADPLPAADAQCAPNEERSDKILFLLNNLSVTNIDAKLPGARELVAADMFHWLATYLVTERVSTEPNNHGLYMHLLMGLEDRRVFVYVLHETFLRVKALLDAEKTMQSTSERTVLKNLASWLGILTLARDRPILHRNIAFPDLLLHGHESRRLIVVIPFVCKVLEHCAVSRVFRPPNPWLMAVLRLLVELYQFADLKLNLKFEIEVLCKGLHVDLQAIEPTRLLPARRPAPPAPRAEGAAELTPGLDKLSVAEYGADATYADSFTAMLQNMAQYIAISPQLLPYANNATWKRVMFLAMERAVQEIITPVVERSVTIASISTRELVSKDFAMEPDELSMRTAAHHMAQNLAGSLALVTCKEPLRISVLAHARTLFAAGGVSEQQLPDQALQLLVHDNLDLACVVIEKTAMETALAKVDEGLAPAYARRREFHAHASGAVFWDRASLSHYSTTLPDPLRIGPPGLSPRQLRVYENLGVSTAPPPRGVDERGEYDELGLSPVHALEQFVQVAADMERFFADAGDAHTLATLPATHYAHRFAPHLAELAAQAVPRDDAVLVLAQKTVQLLYKAHTPLARDVWMGVLEKLCEQSPKVAKEVTAWLLYAEDERKFNVPVTLALLRAQLVGVAEQDQQLAKLLVRSYFRASVVDFAAALAQECLREPACATRAQLAGTLAALRQAAQYGRATPAATQLLDELDEQPAENGVALRDQLAYSFAGWVRVHQQSPNPDKAFIEYVTQLQSQNVLKGEEVSSLFFRVCTEVSVEHYLKQHAAGGGVASGIFAPLDTFASLIVYMVKYHADPLGTNDEQAKVHYLTKILSIIVLVLAQSHEELGARFQQKPFFRLFSSLLHDLHAAEASLHGAYPAALRAIASALSTLQPLFFPGFAFSWMSLVSHRMFLPQLLRAGGDSATAFHRLFVAQLRFLAPFLHGGPLHETTRLLYMATVRLLLLLLHDFPEYLALHHESLCDVMPTTCIQLRNIVLCAYPPGTRVPDPFVPGLALAELPDAQSPPALCYDTRAVLAGVPGVADLVDKFVHERASLASLAALPEMLAQGAAPADVHYSQPVLSALVLHAALACLESGHNLLARDTQRDQLFELCRFLAHELQPEGRYLLLNAAANQLRFPSQHTAYFSALLVRLYTHGSDDLLKEQILRVLLERTIVNRPHPWGLLFTFAHVLRIRAVPLPNAPPEIHAILEHMSQLLTDGRLVPGVVPAAA
ncbi:hypothetical protein MSPP1_000251 [Malassezia sp. CBS 17886]|nr:hypothetical protein MSPP1_000251 [Malassezia sp. CBS 17886]